MEHYASDNTTLLPTGAFSLTIPKKKYLEAALAAAPAVVTNSFIENFIKAIQNDGVAAAIGDIFHKRMQEILGHVSSLTEVN